MLRAIDQDTDSKVMQQWLNDVDFQWACSPTPAVPNNRGMVKQFIEKAADNANRLSFFMICEKPNDDARPECLGADDDYFGKEGKARYPAIGIFNVGRDPVSLRTARFGIALDKQHQSTQTVSAGNLAFTLMCHYRQGLWDGSHAVGDQILLQDPQHAPHRARTCCD